MDGKSSWNKVCFNRYQIKSKCQTCVTGAFLKITVVLERHLLRISLQKGLNLAAANGQVLFGWFHALWQRLIAAVARRSPVLMAVITRLIHASHWLWPAPGAVSVSLCPYLPAARYRKRWIGGEKTRSLHGPYVSADYKLLKPLLGPLLWNWKQEPVTAAAIASFGWVCVCGAVLGKLGQMVVLMLTCWRQRAAGGWRLVVIPPAPPPHDLPVLMFVCLFLFQVCKCVCMCVWSLNPSYGLINPRV